MLGVHQTIMSKIRVFELQAQVKIPAPSCAWSGKPWGMISSLHTEQQDDTFPDWY